MDRRAAWVRDSATPKARFASASSLVLSRRAIAPRASVHATSASRPDSALSSAATWRFAAFAMRSPASLAASTRASTSASAPPRAPPSRASPRARPPRTVSSDRSRRRGSGAPPSRPPPPRRAPWTPRPRARACALAVGLALLGARRLGPRGGEMPRAARGPGRRPLARRRAAAAAAAPPRRRARLVRGRRGLSSASRRARASASTRWRRRATSPCAAARSSRWRSAAADARAASRDRSTAPARSSRPSASASVRDAVRRSSRCARSASSRPALPSHQPAVPRPARPRRLGGVALRLPQRLGLLAEAPRVARRAALAFPQFRHRAVRRGGPRGRLLHRALELREALRELPVLAELLALDAPRVAQRLLLDAGELARRARRRSSSARRRVRRPAPRVARRPRRAGRSPATRSDRTAWPGLWPRRGPGSPPRGPFAAGRRPRPQLFRRPARATGSPSPPTTPALC